MATRDKLAGLYTQVGEWLSGTGPDGDIVITSRVRLARNLAGSQFISRCDEKECVRIEGVIKKALTDAGINGDLVHIGLKDASATDRLFLVERHLISKEHAGADGSRSVAFSPDECLAIMINEEDHLRIQVLKSGLQFGQAWKEIEKVDDILGRHLDYAFSTQYGYLTACPTNVGTGIRVSVMLHLPALDMTRQIEKVYQAMGKINLAVRGYYGERTRALGDFYQISNQITLGKDEESIINSLADVVPQVIQYEQKVRETLLVENRHNLEDRVWRAYGTLKYARSITSDEAMDFLSNVRMGINMKLLKDVDIAAVNALFLQTQPAHLQKMKNSALPQSERDVLRAELIRKTFAGDPKSTAKKKTRPRKKKPDTETDKNNK